MPECRVAIGSRLKQSSVVTTLGLKPNFSDYQPEEVKLIQGADTVYYPTLFYAELLNIMGKKLFPSLQTYLFAQDKIRQTSLFQILGIPHPRTRFFYGKNQKQEILQFFRFPFIAKIPRGSAKGMGIHLIRSMEDLEQYLEHPGPAYVQEYLPVDRDMRVVVIGGQIVLSYWKLASGNDFRTNVAQGGIISFDPLPRAALDLALKTALQCGWNDVGMDIIEYNGSFFVLEANMRYGRKGFAKAGIDYIQLIEQMILSGRI